jgi:hypothetical protein
MPTTFNVISLGVQALIDTTEGNITAENASALVGLTIGDVSNPLWEQTQSFAPGSTGFAGATAVSYDMDNTAANETFTIDGGADQTFDGASLYNATITYVDGSTAVITAVIFQDTAGNTYLAPEFSANADQAALEAGPIRSLTLDSLFGDTFPGLAGTRETFGVVCFAQGTLIKTIKGEVPIEDLRQGDRVLTFDCGYQPISWIGGRSLGQTELEQNPKLRPIRIQAGALGPNLPEQDLIVSPQHRILIKSVIAVRMFDTAEVLVPANKLLTLPGIDIEWDVDSVDYFHMLFEHHQIVFSNGSPTESLFTGPEALKAVSAEARAEIEALFPHIFYPDFVPVPARLIPEKGKQMKILAQRLAKNNKLAQESLIPCSPIS